MWNTLNFELRGMGHKKENVPCQDKTFSLRVDGIIACALSDGAGSALFSHYGAETVTQSVCHFITENFEKIYNTDGRNAKYMILENLLSKLEDKAKKINCKLKDLACTLLAVAIYNDNCIVLHIGDGVIGCLRNNRLEVISFPNNGEFANSTYFVTSSDVINKFIMKKGSTNGMSGFVFMSDGTAESLYSKKNKMLVPIVKNIMQKTVLFNDIFALEFIKKEFDLIVENTNDDCSLGMIVHNDEHLRLYNDLKISDKIELFNLKGKKRFMKKRQKNLDNVIEYISDGICNKNELYRRLKYNKRFIENYIMQPLFEKKVISENNGILTLNLRQ
jgi:hypothetical protein